MLVATSALTHFAARVFQKVGVPDADALLTAETLVEADLRGVHSHGLMRLPSYVRRIEAGLVAPEAHITTIADGRAFVLLDAHHCLGQVVGTRAMGLATRRARENGVEVVAVAHSSHIGAAAYYVMRAAAEGMIGIALTNTVPLMPPIGGTAAVVGNNPLALAIPSGSHMPIVLDMATSVAARGKLINAKNRGERIPLDWGVDRRGQPTDRPEEVLEGGMLLPVAGHKGFGLAMIIDLLCGPLTGSGWSWDVAGLALPEFNRPQNAGHVFMAIDIRQFRPLPAFLEDVDRYVERVHATPRVPGVERIYVPGEIEFETAAQRRKAGIPLDRQLLDTLRALGNELSIDPGWQEDPAQIRTDPRQ